MDGIGSIGSLAVFAARVFAPAQSAPAVVQAAAAVPSATAGPSLPADTATQYQMSVLSKAMYASADQALALLQMLPQPASPLR
jgi:hypothetical protein